MTLAVAFDVDAEVLALALHTAACRVILVQLLRCGIVTHNTAIYRIER